jgi:hypothetical protein
VLESQKGEAMPKAVLIARARVDRPSRWSFFIDRRHWACDTRRREHTYLSGLLSHESTAFAAAAKLHMCIPRLFSVGR